MFQIHQSELIIIAGGDTRQKYLYDRLQNDGFNVTPYDVPDVPVSQDIAKSVSYETFQKKLSECRVLILPIPYSKDKKTVNSSFSLIRLNMLISCMSSGTCIIGGCFHQDFVQKCQEKNIAVHDLMDNTSFEILNSIATAEGAIAEAIVKSPVNLHLSKCLVTGYGKCAKAICERLGGLHAEVTVCARNPEQRTNAFAHGYHGISFEQLPSLIGQYHFIFNTVPSVVLTDNLLQNIRQETVIIDIASIPGGTDFPACEKYHLNAWLCSSLPGRYSPKTSGDIIYECILSFLNNQFESLSS